MSKDDYETWVRDDIANTLNNFDGGGTRATTVIVDETDDSNRYVESNYD